MSATLVRDAQTHAEHGLAEVSARRRRRGAVVGLGLTLLIVALLAVTLSVGDVPLPLSRVVATLVGRGDETSTLVLVEFRLPRLVLGLLVGLAFGLSGALFQSVLRNPLASPDIIGISQGASVGAVTALLLLGLGGVAVSVAAVLGAAVVGILNYALSWRDGVTGYRFVLCGIGLSFVASSVLGYLLTRSDARAAQDALAWLSGSVASADWEGNARLALALAVLVPVALALAPGLGMLGLGDDTAVALGVRAEHVRLLALAVGTGLAGVATAAAGPVAFVALASAPIARRLVGHGSLALVPSALVGVAIVTASDLVALHLIPDVQVPVGIVTGVLGGVYLIWLLAVARPGSGNR